MSTTSKPPVIRDSLLEAIVLAAYLQEIRR
jgi:hypothetical protein